MSKPFSTITGLLLLLGAAVHGFRLYSGFDVVLGSHHIPVWYSWPAAAVAALLGLMVLVEAR